MFMHEETKFNRLGKVHCLGSCFTIAIRLGTTISAHCSLLGLNLRSLDDDLEKLILLAFNKLESLDKFFISWEANIVTLFVSPHQAERSFIGHVRIKSDNLGSKEIVTSSCIFINFKSSDFLAWKSVLVGTSMENCFHLN